MLQPKSLHWINNCAFAREKFLRVIAWIVERHIEIASGKDSVSTGIGAANECRQVRDDPVRRTVRVPNLPLAFGRRVRRHPSRVHGPYDKRLRLLGSNARSGNGPDSANREFFRRHPTYWADLVEPINADSVGQFHYHRPPVEQPFGTIFARIRIPNMRIPMSFGTDIDFFGDIVGDALCFLQ